MHIPSTLIYVKILQLKTPNILTPVTGELGAISKLSYRYFAKRAVREHVSERRNRPLLSRLLSRAQSRASTFHDIPQMESLLSGYSLFPVARVSRSTLALRFGAPEKSGKKSPFLQAFTYTCISSDLYNHL